VSRPAFLLASPVSSLLPAPLPSRSPLFALFPAVVEVNNSVSNFCYLYKITTQFVLYVRHGNERVSIGVL